MIYKKIVLALFFLGLTGAVVGIVGSVICMIWYSDNVLNWTIPTLGCIAITYISLQEACRLTKLRSPDSDTTNQKGKE